MNILNQILSNYAQFFNIEIIKTTLSNPTNWGLILTLVIMEGLLSSDNALVLAMIVNKLPENKQGKALLYGIWGAYLFRFLVIGIGTYLIKFTWIKLLAAFYLLYMVISYFRGSSENNNEDSCENNCEVTNTVKKGFWGTVLKVELMDITFSIDSVSAAFGVSNQVWILFLGAILGILMMRGVAQIFVKLIKKVPEMETTAYVLIAIIGIKMILSIVGFEITDIAFFILLIVTFCGTFIVHKVRMAM